MAMNDVTLGLGVRQNLLQLQLVSSLLNRTSERLATGKRVNSAIDDPSNYFTALSHTNRASDFSVRKDAMGEAIQAAEAASNGIEAIQDLIDQMQGLADDARSSDTAGRADLATQFGELRTQIDNLADDASYNGTNFLDSDTLTVEFNEDGTTSLDIVGFDAHVAGDLSIAAATNAWVADTDIDAAVADLETATTELRTQASTLSSNLGIVTARQSFTDRMIATLQTGADNLTLADPNEESANMLALQTRQQLGVSSLGLAAQAEQAILRLF
jgi:flagellin-like hook-associated protein FlgL